MNEDESTIETIESIESGDAGVISFRRVFGEGFEWYELHIVDSSQGDPGASISLDRSMCKLIKSWCDRALR